MLRFNSSQFSILEVQIGNAFISKVCRFILDTFKDASALPRNELDQALGIQVQRARRYGLQTERQIIAYVITAWLLGEMFDEELPAARLALSAPDFSAEDKRIWLEEWTVKLLSTLSPERVVSTLG